MNVKEKILEQRANHLYLYDLCVLATGFLIGAVFV